MLHDWKHPSEFARIFAAIRFVSKTVVHLIFLLALIGVVSSTTFSQDTPSDPQAPRSSVENGDDKSVPVYGFETQYINEWLELGPLLTDDAVADPETGLSEPVDGKEVLMKSGETAVWHRVSLTPPSYYDRPKKARKLIYMFCKIRKTEVMHPGRYQFYFGSDDAGKVFMDGELVVEFMEPRWHQPLSDPFQLLVSDHEIDCLLELRDMGGNHSFSLGAGYSFRGRCLCLDNSTPQPNVSVSLMNGTTSLETVWSDSTGLFEFDLVPYAAESHLVLTSGTKRIRWPSAGALKLKDGIAKIPLPVATQATLERYSAREGFPGGAINTIAEMPDGRIIAAATNTAFVFGGNRAFEKYRLPDECVISGIVVKDDGTVWLGTQESGLYQVQGDHPPKQFAVNQLGDCIYDIALDASGTLWVSSGRAPFKYLHDSQLPCSIHQIDNNRHIKKQDIGNTTLIIDIACHPTAGVAFVQLDGPIFILGNDGNVKNVEPWPTMKKNLISSIAFDPLGQLWLNRTEDIGYLEASGKWKVISVPYHVASHLPRSRTCVDILGNVWLTKTNWLFQIQNDQAVFISKTGVTSEICATRNGSVYVATSEGVSKVVAQPVKFIDHRYGMTLKSPTRIESLGDSVMVSGEDGSMQVDADGNASWIDDRFVVNSTWGSRYRFHRGLMKYSRSDVDTTVRPIELFADNTKRRVNTIVQPVDSTPYNSTLKLTPSPKILTHSVCYFPESLDYGLLGQNGEIYELRGDQLKISNLFENQYNDRSPRAIMDILFVPPGDSVSGFWVTRDDEQVLWKSSSGNRVFELASKHNQAHRFFHRSNGELLIATTNGIRSVDVESGELVEAPWMRSFSNYDVVEIAESKSGMLWIATRSSGIFGMRNGILSSLDTVKHLKDIHIFDIELDDLENLWIAAAKGLFVFTPNHIPPTVSIESLTIGNKRIRAFSTSNPPEGYLEDSLVVRLAGSDDTSRSTSFRYRTKETNGDWRQVPANQDTIVFQIIGKGDLLVEFQAVDQDANVSDPVELIVRTKLHYWQTAWFHATVVLLGAGSILFLVGLTYIANRNRVEKRKVLDELFREQRRAKEFAEEASQEKILLLARVCHDLRSPLSILQLCLERDVNSKSEGEQLRKLLSESASQMTYLTDQLLSYSATENPRELMKEVVGIAEFFSLIESSTTLRLADSPVECRVELAPNAPRWLELDRRRFTEVLNNLIENSLKHTESGWIQLSYSTATDGRPKIRVIDTGIGMTDLTLKKVLTPFFQDPGSNDSNGINVGVGLGLAICNSLIQQMGGEFNITSEFGTGTEATITLPCSVISDGQGYVNQTHGRVFLIDSNSSQRRSLRQLLNSIQWKCESGDPTINVDIIRRFKPDAVIIDLNSDLSSPLKIARTLRDLFGENIVLIAMSSPTNIIAAANAQLFDHLIDKSHVFQSNTEKLVHLLAAPRHN